MKSFSLIFAVIISMIVPAHSGVEKLMKLHGEIKAGEAAQAEINRLNQRINALEVLLNKLRNQNNSVEIDRLKKALTRLQADGKTLG